MSMTLNHLGSIWYHSEPSGVTYSTNQFLDLDFFVISYSKAALAIRLLNCTEVGLDWCWLVVEGQRVDYQKVANCIMSC